jgi:hypothetical protein
MAPVSPPGWKAPPTGSLRQRKSRDNRPLFRPIFAALLALFLLLLPGCPLRKSPTPDLTPAEQNAEAEARTARIWRLFQARANSAEALSGPFRIAANLRYSDPEGKNTRVSALLWGNGETDSPYPLRLDLLAGIGAVAAKVREDENSFTAFVPDENTAYVHDGGTRTLASFGVPIPLSLSDLTLLLTGRGGALFLPAHGAAADVPPGRGLGNGGARYAIPDAPLPGELELSETGALLAWNELRDKGWSMAFEPGDDNPLQPEKLRISHPAGYSALVVVKEIARISLPYPTANMELPLPPGAMRTALAE